MSGSSTQWLWLDQVRDVMMKTLLSIYTSSWPTQCVHLSKRMHSSTLTPFATSHTCTFVCLLFNFPNVCYFMWKPPSKVHVMCVILCIACLYFTVCNMGEGDTAILCAKCAHDVHLCMCLQHYTHLLPCRDHRDRVYLLQLEETFSNYIKDPTK